jgi:hypothetical protein
MPSTTSAALREHRCILGREGGDGTERRHHRDRDAGRRSVRHGDHAHPQQTEHDPEAGADQRQGSDAGQRGPHEPSLQTLGEHDEHHSERREQGDEHRDVQDAVPDDHEVGVRGIDRDGRSEREQHGGHGCRKEAARQHGAQGEEEQGDAQAGDEPDEEQEGQRAFERDAADDVAVLGQHAGARVVGREGRQPHHEAPADAADEDAARRRRPDRRCEAEHGRCAEDRERPALVDALGGDAGDSGHGGIIVRRQTRGEEGGTTSWVVPSSRRPGRAVRTSRRCGRARRCRRCGRRASSPGPACAACRRRVRPRTRPRRSARRCAPASGSRWAD